MSAVHASATHQSARRAAFGVAAVLALGAAVTGAIVHGGGWWLLAAFAIGPDVALLLGAGRGLERGRLHPRAVRLYNAAHGYWGPALLAVATVALPAGFLIGALAWAFHISLDRAVGYGMRTRDGFQRS
jgi:Domain of unknown function (DUF4260)